MVEQWLRDYAGDPAWGDENAGFYVMAALAILLLASAMFLRCMAFVFRLFGLRV